MKKSDVKVSRTGVVSATQQVPPVYFDGITVHLYEDVEEEPRNYSFHAREAGYIAEDMCVHIAKQLGIGAISFPIFALRRMRDDLWLAPNEVVTFEDGMTTDEFRFRIRFVLPNDQIRRLLDSDPVTFAYLFLQVNN